MTLLAPPTPLRTAATIERQYCCQLRDLLVALRYHLRLDVAETAHELQVPVSTAARWLREYEVEAPAWEPSAHPQQFSG